LSSFWFIIKQQWTIEDISIFGNSSHLEWKVGLSDINLKGTHPLKPLNQIKLNLAGMVPRWVPFKIVSDSPALHSRWLLLLKIEISSIVHCLNVIFYQNMPNLHNRYRSAERKITQKNAEYMLNSLSCSCS
jgi:hypothetical protein